VNYRAEIAKARRRRARRIERAEAETREVIARLAAERDREILRLEAEGVKSKQIAARVGCSPSQVYDTLHPERRALYNARRRDHWHHLRAVA
jgi:FixJ family two-component response regulator